MVEPHQLGWWSVDLIQRIPQRTCILVRVSPRVVSTHDLCLSYQNYFHHRTKRPSPVISPLPLGIINHPPSRSNSRLVPFSTAAAHEELSVQLTQMATQLKRNAVPFSDTLARDQAVVKETKLKVKPIHDSMQKERTRLQNHTGKRRGATWLTLFSIILVFVSFFVVFFILPGSVIVHICMV